jgi:TonB family protein
MKSIVLAAAILLGAVSTAASAADVDMNDSVRPAKNGALDKPKPIAIPGITPPKAANDHSVKNYPEISRVNGEQGAVVLSFIVNADGTESNAEVVKSSGYPRLDQAAVDEVTANWRYVPAMRDGKPIQVRLETVVRWALNNHQDDPLQHLELAVKDFPPGAYDRGETGTTTVLAIFDTNGHFLVASLLQTSGYSDLDEAAKKIERGWTTTVPLFNGKAITFAVPVALHWPVKQ